MSLISTDDLRMSLYAIKAKVNQISTYFYNLIINNINQLLIIALILSIIFGIVKTLFFTGYNVDSYQIFALSVEKWIKTGERDYLINNYYARNRFLYPLIIALTHLFIPIDISVLGSLINLIFAIFGIFLMRKLLEIYEFSLEEINLFSLLIVLSYNYLNFWFNILTDMTGLFFFLMMLLCLELYLSKENTEMLTKYSYLGLSLFFFLLTFFSREVYFFAGVLFFVVIRPKKLRMVVILISVWIFFLVLENNKAELVSIMEFLPREYWNAILSSDYPKLLAELNMKWENSIYVSDFVKGLIKVGILPAILLILITLSLIIIRKLIHVLKTKNYRLTFRFRTSKNYPFRLMTVWFIFYFLFYSLLYSNIGSPTGLRYWLPISWIPLAFISKIIIRVLETNYIKVLMIVFLCLFPFSWSVVELYVNRNNVTGTGPIFQQDTYVNNMSDMLTINSFQSKHVNISKVNNSYFETVSTPGAYEEDDRGHLRSRFSFAIWLNSTTNLTIKVRLKTPNNAYWGISLYEVRSDFLPGFGRLQYNEQYLEANSTFQVFTLQASLTSHLRMVFLSVGGGIGATIIWDYIKITVK